MFSIFPGQVYAVVLDSHPLNQCANKGERALATLLASMPGPQGGMSELATPGCSVGFLEGPSFIPLPWRGAHKARWFMFLSPGLFGRLLGQQIVIARERRKTTLIWTMNRHCEGAK